MFMPVSWMGFFLHAAAPGDAFRELWAKSSILFYMLRTTGGLYAWIGASFLVAAQDPTRHLPWIKTSGAAMLFFVAVCVAAGVLYHLPPAMYLIDALLAGLGAFFLLRFSRRPWKNNNTVYD